MSRSPFHELLAMNNDGRERKPKLPNVGQVAVLMEAQARLTRVICPFKVGDLVTPVSNSICNEAGQPNLVLWHREPKMSYDAETVGDGFIAGLQPDILVAWVCDNGDVHRSWTYSGEYESYTGERE